MISIKARIVGPENVTILEKCPVSLQAIPCLVEMLSPNETYLEVSLEETPAVNPNQN